MQFSDLIGHNSLKKHLVAAVKEDRISHAQLFSGAEGSAALPLAIAYAQFIACTNRSETDSCGVCNSCLKMGKLIHPDLHFTLPVNQERSSTEIKTADFLVQWRSLFLKNPFIGLEDWSSTLDLGNKQPFISNFEAHEKIKALSFKSFESEYKFLIIWLPEKMRVEGANSLLKTLEEPPEKTLIILVTQDYESLLKTIISRTQLIKVPNYTSKEATEVLMKLSGIGEDRCRLAAEISEGNISQALWLIENGEEVDQQLDMFRNWMLYCYGFNVSELLKLTDHFAKETREWQKSFFAYALYMIRQTLLMNHQNSLNRITESEQHFIEKFRRFFNSGNYSIISGYINEASIHAERNAHAKILFFDTSLLISDVFRKEKERAKQTV